MLHQLINRSADLKRLRDEGYEMEQKGGYLLIHHVPYVNPSKQVKYGTLVSVLDQQGEQTARPRDHIAHFIGETPCYQDGNPMNALINSSQPQQFLPDLIVTHLFSNKPMSGYPDFYQKMTRYIEMLSAPAKSLDASVTACTFGLVKTEDETSPHQYYDTNSSRAKIEMVNNKLSNQIVTIIGLGGTGAYILDMLSKTPVKEIHIYDGDVFLQHNAFRAPGAAGVESFVKDQKSKVDYYADIYSKMHRGMKSHAYYLTENNIAEISCSHCVFIAIDRSDVRKMIVDYLMDKKIPFIDVGMGVNLVDDKIIGMLRTTTGTALKNDHLEKRLPQGDEAENEYNTNIQIVELNALNAIQAVIKWKKMLGFYHDSEMEHESCYIIDESKIVNDDSTA